MGARRAFLACFKAWFPKAPVNRVRRVVMDGDQAELHYALHPPERVTKDELRRILIRTTDAGPFDSDVFLVLETDKRACVVPIDAEGYDRLFEWATTLPGFDGGTYLESMSCTENREFVCWKRSENAACENDGGA